MKRTTPKKNIEDLIEDGFTEYDLAPIRVVPLQYKTHRKGAYDDSYPARMLELAKLGLTIAQLALAFGVKKDRLEKWMGTHEELEEAYLQGKNIHDYAVQTTLLRRAMGYSYIEVKRDTGTDAQGRPVDHTTRYIKHMAPDMTAIMFWLKNRHPGEWNDVRKAEISNTVDVNVNNTLQLERLSPEERKLVRGMAIKQIEGMNGLSGN